VSGSTVVIGVGNPLVGDDGLGLAALERLRAGWSFDPPVALEDGGTWGLTLLPLIEDAEQLLFLDAIDVGEAAGSAVALEREELPRMFALKLSPHEVDLRDLLALAELRGSLPARTVALGIQPERIEWAEGLSLRCAAALDDLVERAVRKLEAWGHRARPAQHGASA